MIPEAIVSETPKPLANYSEAYRVGHLVFAAGQVANDYVRGIPPEARVDPSFPYYGSDIKLQTRYILDNLRGTFEGAGSSLSNVIKAQVFMRDLSDFDGFDEVWKDYFGENLPARTTVGTTGLLGSGPNQLVEVDLIGHTADVDHEVIISGNPHPLANYTEAIRVGNLVFAAGQVANDFVSGVPPEARVDPDFPFYGSNIKLQTRYILENLRRTLEAADSSLAHVVKAQVFLRDLNDFNGFDEMWQEYFGTDLPPRTTVGTTQLLASGPEQLLEIDLIAHTEGTTKRVVTSDAPRPLANYSEAVVVDGLVFAAGQLASDFKTGIAPEARTNSAFPFYGSDIKLQTHYTLRNLERTFAAAGSSLKSAFKAQVFMTDLRSFAAFDEVWKQQFGDRLPARTTVGTTGLLVPGALIEVDLIGAVENG
jgi:enamine deaminase RidA (YjgF/YER057c/UK114 family)